MSKDGVDNGRRRFLLWSTSAVGAAGAVGIAVPFVKSWLPSARAQAAGAPVEVDVSKLKEGQSIKTAWRGKPIFVVKRSPNSVNELEGMADKLKDPKSEKPDTLQPGYIGTLTRSIKDDILVVVGICTHLGCVPQHKKELSAGENGGFFCPCHGSKFDLAGRVYSGVPASNNLEIPPYSYINDNTIMIGVDQEGAA
ncbi:ubiquinol-cytochrome c reductase iron-sulfur subunit [Pleionea mediterranea]|jgi:ubiquinol-cytochrome c reductase iron-sulfur subunit|uniref:Ubiquinol-cytochrome c reductase iron-sulfur subunit n=1 Tax=Pleionea mediterranea TaxID=523701 RepID=A0A316FGM1_9GAMM|nr:ubiquinol-cytochrome c reductase iron-sulfur subunit [Pleionea mediterranea]PWK47954.1 ubiquinol-cytochrome c reductase iron-sulfur subunit [Pleionea mediterranea]